MIRRIVISPRNPNDPVTVGGSLGRLEREFPTLAIEVRSLPLDAPSPIDVDRWRDPDADLREFDAQISDAAATGTLGLVASGPVEHAALEVLTRCQGLIDRRNDASATRLFDRVVAARVEYCDRDRATALDVWQWTLRLAPGASLALQLAALFCDSFRPPLDLDPCPEDDASTLRRLFARLAVPTPVAGRACALLRRLEERSLDAELAVLDEAAALSFFSRRSDAALRAEGFAATRAMTRLALYRLRPAARVRLLHVRLAPPVWRFVEEALRAEARC